MTTPAAEFIDRTLRAEGSEERAIVDAARIGGGLRFYGASVGAVRAAVRDAGWQHPELSHDEVTALASDLWSEPVYERRLAAVFRRLGDQFGIEPRRDDGVEHVLDDGVRLGDDADLPGVLRHELGDDVRREVGLAGAGRALHGEVRVVEVAQ